MARALSREVVFMGQHNDPGAGTYHSTVESCYCFSLADVLKVEEVWDAVCLHRLAFLLWIIL
jgi:hypothetical protein